MSKQLDSLSRIAIKELKIEMYLSENESISHTKKINHPGYKRQKDTIANLNENGITHAHISNNLPQSSNSFEIFPGKYSSIPDCHQLIKAKELIEKSKLQLDKLFSTIYSTNHINIKGFRELGHDIVENIFERPDSVMWINGIREKSANLLEHSLNVAFYLASFGRYLKFNRQNLEELAIGGLIHDIGKMFIRDEVLNKSDKLTPEEFMHMKEHQTFSQPLLNGIKDLSCISRDISLMHHEKIDGTGYPNKLKGMELSLVGRMAGIVDIYDALTSERCYKKAYSPTEAFKIMTGLTPFHLDKKLLRQFIQFLGFFPIGSLVELNNGHVGLVYKENRDDLNTPVVKVFFSIKTGVFREVEYVDLKKHPLIKITRGLTESSLNKSFKDYR